jgi:hypothetical protein
MVKLLASSAKPLHRSQQPSFLWNRLRGHGGLGTAVCLFLNTEAASTSSSSGTKDLTNVEASSSKHSLTVKSSTAVPANLVTALVEDEEWSVLDSVSGPVTLPILPKPTSVVKESTKD